MVLYYVKSLDRIFCPLLDWITQSILRRLKMGLPAIFVAVIERINKLLSSPGSRHGKTDSYLYKSTYTQGSICNKAGLETHVEKLWNYHHIQKLEVPRAGRASCPREGGKNSPPPLPKGWQLPDCLCSALWVGSGAGRSGTLVLGEGDQGGGTAWCNHLRCTRTSGSASTALCCRVEDRRSPPHPPVLNAFECCWCVFFEVFIFMYLKYLFVCIWSICLYVFIWIVYSWTPAVRSFCIALDSAANSLTQHWTMPGHRVFFLP